MDNWGMLKAILITLGFALIFGLFLFPSIYLVRFLFGENVVLNMLILIGVWSAVWVVLWGSLLAWAKREGTG